MAVIEWVWLLAVAVLGAVVGSFLNVVIHRLPQGTFFSDGKRSVCANPACKRPIAWFDNIPILSWAALRGKARCCGQPISVRYPLVEALGAVLLVALWLAPPGGAIVDPNGLDLEALARTGLYAYFGAVLIAGSFIDIAHRILPDALTKPTIVIGLLGALVFPGLAGRLSLTGVTPAVDSLLCSALGAGVGLAATWTVRLLARLVFRKDAMGLGDVKLMGAIGAFVGWQGVLLTFFLGSVLGAIVGVVHRLRTGDAYIFFGPFLALGALISLFASEPILATIDDLQRWQQTHASALWITATVAVVCIILLVMLVRSGRAP